MAKIFICLAIWSGKAWRTTNLLTLSLDQGKKVPQGSRA